MIPFILVLNGWKETEGLWSLSLKRIRRYVKQAKNFK